MEYKTLYHVGFHLAFWSQVFSLLSFGDCVDIYLFCIKGDFFFSFTFGPKLGTNEQFLINGMWITGMYPICKTSVSDVIHSFPWKRRVQKWKESVCLSYHWKKKHPEKQSDWLCTAGRNIFSLCCWDFVLVTRTFVFLNPNELPSMSFFNVQVLDHI